MHRADSTEEEHHSHCLLFPVTPSMEARPSGPKDKALCLKEPSPRSQSGPQQRPWEPCSAHVPSCLLFCRKAWIWERSCSPCATCQQQAGSPSQ